MPTSSSPLSVTSAVLVTSREASPLAKSKIMTVGSSIRFPSKSSPSSLISLTLFVCPGELAVTVTEFSICPVTADALVIRYVAL